MATLSTFQVCVTCPDMIIRFRFIIRSEGANPSQTVDCNLHVKFAIYFVTNAVSGCASFNFRPATPIEGPDVHSTIRLVVLAQGTDRPPSHRIFFHSPDLDGREMGADFRGLIGLQPELQPQIAVEFHAPSSIVYHTGFSSFLNTSEVSLGDHASIGLTPVIVRDQTTPQEDLW